ncbi:MAG: hypothetical protein R3B06_07480 [Kofleriaceae bacterium]
MPDPELPALDAGARAALRALADDLAAQPGHGDLAHRLEALIDLLVRNGQLLPEHQAWLAGLHGDRTLVKLTVGPPKRTLASPPVDCAALLPLCRGRCCGLVVTLTREDLVEGGLRWDVHDPYLLSKDPVSGYCVHMARDGGCGCYDARPGTCRVYDCRADPRVWVDYDARIPAPLAPHLVPPMP